MPFSCSPRVISSRCVQFSALIVAMGVGSACSTSSTAAAGDANAPFAVELTKASVSIVNQTGTGIAGGTLNLVPVGFPRPYFVMLPRMTTGEKRSFPLETFRMLDGTKYRLNVTKVKSIKVEAKDVVGKPIEYEIPVD